jgi:hypothetical protein
VFYFGVNTHTGTALLYGEALCFSSWHLLIEESPRAKIRTHAVHARHWGRRATHWAMLRLQYTTLISYAELRSTQMSYATPPMSLHVINIRGGWEGDRCSLTPPLMFKYSTTTFTFLSSFVGFDYLFLLKGRSFDLRDRVLTRLSRRAWVWSGLWSR